MPALAKQALSENGISPRPSANGKGTGAKKVDSADAWSEVQKAAFVQVGMLSYANFSMYATSLCSAHQPAKGELHLVEHLDPSCKLRMQALKDYRDHPERWDRVANAVDGKSKQACRARYKELREQHKAGKS